MTEKRHPHLSPLPRRVRGRKKESREKEKEFRERGKEFRERGEARSP